jgi:acyl-CoA dehydrogenase
MDLSIPRETQEILESLGRFIADEVLPLEEKFLKEDEVPHQEHMKVRGRARDQGFYGAFMPQAVGGKGLGILDTCLLVEEIFKQGCERFGEDIYGGIGGPHPALMELSAFQKEKYLLPLMNADMTCCFALTEPGAGSDISAQETSANRDGVNYILNGRKFLITNAPFADLAVISAVTDPEKGTKGGLSCFLVDRKSRGYSVKAQDTIMRDGMQGEIILQDCHVPAENLIREQGAGYNLIMEWIEFERVMLAAGCVGLSQRLLDMSIKHSMRRVQFKEQLSRHQAIQMMLADMATELSGSRMMLYDIAWRMDQGQKLSRQVCMLKLFTTEMTGKAADTAFQIHGGRAALREMPLERIFRRTRLLRLILGTSEIQRMIIARDLLHK